MLSKVSTALAAPFRNVRDLGQGLVELNRAVSRNPIAAAAAIALLSRPKKPRRPQTDSQAGVTPFESDEWEARDTSRVE